MGEAVGISEASVIARLDRYQSLGLVSRIGAVFRPHSVGMSTLAALAVPSEELERVAELVNGYARRQPQLRAGSSLQPLVRCHR